MSWTNVEKNFIDWEDQKILTPDGKNILVGEFEDQILIYLLGGSNWDKDSKETSSYSNEDKNTSSWGNISKEESSFTNQSKNSSSWTNINKT